MDQFLNGHKLIYIYNFLQTGNTGILSQLNKKCMQTSILNIIVNAEKKSVCLLRNETRIPIHNNLSEDLHDALRKKTYHCLQMTWLYKA